MSAMSVFSVRHFRLYEYRRQSESLGENQVADTNFYLRTALMASVLIPANFLSTVGSTLRNRSEFLVNAHHLTTRQILSVSMCASSTSLSQLRNAPQISKSLIGSGRRDSRNMSQSFRDGTRLRSARQRNGLSFRLCLH